MRWMKAAMTEEQQTEHDSDYQSLTALFIALLKSLHNNDKEEALYALSELRTDIAFKHVVKGLGISIDEAITLLENANDDNLTKHDKDLIDRLKAAILNLIDFSVCEEYQLYDEVIDIVGDSEIDFNSDDYDELLALCKKYNDQYSAIENGDIEYAGAVAALWVKMSATDYAVYWTQNDAKVRPWHMALQGYAAPKQQRSSRQCSAADQTDILSAPIAAHIPKQSFIIHLQRSILIEKIFTENPCKSRFLLALHK